MRVAYKMPTTKKEFERRKEEGTLQASGFLMTAGEAEKILDRMEVQQ